MRENEISRIIVESAVEVHRTLGGPGLLEPVYKEALAYELTTRGLHISRQAPVPLDYKGASLSTPLRLDLLVENLVIVEAKAVTSWHPVFEAQALTYLRLTGKKLCLIINFGEALVKNGIKRVVNAL